MVQDNIADMLTRMRNALQMRYETVEVNGTKMTLGIAEILKKEAYAISFNSSEGSVAVKDNNSVLSISNEIVTECIYNLVASLFKIKLDELRRIIDILKTILMSRLSEMKMSSGITQQIEDAQNI